MKKVLCVLLTTILLMGCFSAALAEEYPEGTLYKGMKGHTAEIKELQQWLKDLGYLDDKVDGKFGDRLIKEYSKKLTFEVDRKYGA